MPNSVRNKESSKKQEASSKGNTSKNPHATSYMLHTTELKEFIHSFDFWEPDWTSLPPNIPKIPNSSLSPYEQGLLTAIKLAYLNSKHGRKYVKKKFVKAGGVTIVSVAIIAFIQLTITSPAVSVVKTVAAATMSAILR